MLRTRIEDSKKGDGVTLVFFGTGAFGLASLHALKRSTHHILAVVTSPDKPRGRRLEIVPGVVKAWALENGVPVVELYKNGLEALERLKKLCPDVFVVIAFGTLLKEEWLTLPRRGAFNVHASLLPRYRGAAPIRRAILNGETETGVTVMRMTAYLDAGDIALQKKLNIGPEEDAVSLEKRLSVLGAEALLEVLKRVEDDKITFVSQKESEATYASKITKEDGRVHWEESAEAVLNRIRAMAGWPGAFSFHRGKRLLLLEAKPSSVAVSPEQEWKPGAVKIDLAKGTLLVRAQDGFIEITRLQPESRKSLHAREFLKGYPLQSGDFLE